MIFRQWDQMEGLDLKVCIKKKDDLLRGDIILHNNDIWVCASQTMCKFSNTITKQLTSIEAKSYVTLFKLELIPVSWKVEDSRVSLVGRELGLGPTHTIQVIGMTSFAQLDIVKSYAQKGIQKSYKVVLCETKKEGCMLIVGVDLMS